MVKEVEVRQGGLLTTVQDSGRFGYQQYGMPVAGAMDEFSYRVGNLLVQNHENSPSLEATIKGPELFFRGSAFIAVTGAPAAPQLNGKEIPMWKTVYVEDASTLSFNPLQEGCRFYIAVAGGFSIPPLMGSSSTYLRGALGGFKGRRLHKGDIIPLNEPAPGEKDAPKQLLRLKKDAIPLYSSHQVVRVVFGPQDDYFTSNALKYFEESSYTLSPQSDRMGCRLEGPLLQHSGKPEIISDGMPPGAVQVPGHGNPIIMLSDRPTTGGYPKIATVISADLPKASQLKPGDTISFEKVSLEKAQRIRKDFEEKIYLLQNKEPYSDEYSTYEIIVNNRRFLVKIKKL